MKKIDVYAGIEAVCSSSLAESWDNCGVQINTEQDTVEKILVALEITDSIIDEAIENHIDLIVTHHPMFLFTDIKSLDAHDFLGGMIHRLISHGISVYSCHTSFDGMTGGNNDYIGELLGIEDIKRFPEGDASLCRIGALPQPMRLGDVASSVAEKLSMEERKLRVVGNPDAVIQQIGWCTGAGADYFQDAKDLNCDLFITGDVKYHNAQMARGIGLNVIDAGHYGTEIIFIDNMADKLKEKLECEIIKSVIDIDPFL